jgi:hypothetical protein
VCQCLVDAIAGARGHCSASLPHFPHLVFAIRLAGRDGVALTYNCSASQINPHSCRQVIDAQSGNVDRDAKELAAQQRMARLRYDVQLCETNNAVCRSTPLRRQSALSNHSNSALAGSPMSMGSSSKQKHPAFSEDKTPARRKQCAHRGISVEAKRASTGRSVLRCSRQIGHSTSARPPPALSQAAVKVPSQRAAHQAARFAAPASPGKTGAPVRVKSRPSSKKRPRAPAKGSRPALAGSCTRRQIVHLLDEVCDVDIALAVAQHGFHAPGIGNPWRDCLLDEDKKHLSALREALRGVQARVAQACAPTPDAAAKAPEAPPQPCGHDSAAPRTCAARTTRITDGRSHSPALSSAQAHATQQELEVVRVPTAILRRHQRSASGPGTPELAHFQVVPPMPVEALASAWSASHPSVRALEGQQAAQQDKEDAERAHVVHGHVPQGACEPPHVSCAAIPTGSPPATLPQPSRVSCGPCTVDVQRGPIVSNSAARPLVASCTSLKATAADPGSIADTLSRSRFPTGATPELVLGCSGDSRLQAGEWPSHGLGAIEGDAQLEQASNSSLRPGCSAAPTLTRAADSALGIQPGVVMRTHVFGASRAFQRVQMPDCPVTKAEPRVSLRQQRVERLRLHEPHPATVRHDPFSAVQMHAADIFTPAKQPQAPCWAVALERAFRSAVAAQAAKPRTPALTARSALLSMASAGPRVSPSAAAVQGTCHGGLAHNPSPDIRPAVATVCSECPIPEPCLSPGLSAPPAPTLAVQEPPDPVPFNLHLDAMLADPVEPPVRGTTVSEGPHIAAIRPSPQQLQHSMREQLGKLDTMDVRSIVLLCVQLFATLCWAAILNVFLHCSRWTSRFCLGAVYRIAIFLRMTQPFCSIPCACRIWSCTSRRLSNLKRSRSRTPGLPRPACKTLPTASAAASMENSHLPSSISPA